MDLERNKVVEEWTATGNRDASITSIAAAAKGSDSDVFLACNSRGLYTFDPRVSGGKAVSSKTYATNHKLSCLAATPAGQIVAGCATGELKLYKEVG
jgi:hypothetical protein